MIIHGTPRLGLAAARSDDIILSKIPGATPIGRFRPVFGSPGLGLPPTFRPPTKPLRTGVPGGGTITVGSEFSAPGSQDKPLVTMTTVQPPMPSGDINESIQEGSYGGRSVPEYVRRQILVERARLRRQPTGTTKPTQTTQVTDQSIPVLTLVGTTTTGQTTGGTGGGTSGQTGSGSTGGQSSGGTGGGTSGQSQGGSGSSGGGGGSSGGGGAGPWPWFDTGAKDEQEGNEVKMPPAPAPKTKSPMPILLVIGAAIGLYALTR